MWDNRIVGPSVVDALSFGAILDYTPPIAGMGPGTVVGDGGVNLFDFIQTASKAGKLIPLSFNLSDYGIKTFDARQVNVDTGQAFFVDGVITALSMVPEPSTLLLLLLGIPLILLRSTEA